MGIWDKLKQWAGKDKNVAPSKALKNETISYDGAKVSPTKKYCNGKERGRARAMHRFNARQNRSARRKVNEQSPYLSFQQLDAIKRLHGRRAGLALAGLVRKQEMTFREAMDS